MTTSRLSRLPRWISHWLGYRPETPKPLPPWQIALWSFIAAFCGVTIVQAVFIYSEYFTSRGVSGIVASFVSKRTPDLHLPTSQTSSPNNNQPGCFRRPRLRRNRSTPRSTTRPNLRPFLQRSNRRLHHKTIQLNPRPSTFRITPLAGSLAIHGPCNRRHAVDRHHAPASRCNGPAPGYR